MTAVARDEPAPKAVEACATLTVEAVYRRHAQEVVRWAARLGGPKADLEDIVQEVFVRVQKDLAGFRGEARLTTWLFQITRNVVGQRRLKNRFWGLLSGGAEETAGHLASPHTTQFESVVRKQATERLYRVLDQMSERYRTVFLLFELERLSGEEIATAMDARVETVWVWLHRARAQFFKKLEQVQTQEDRS